MQDNDKEKEELVETVHNENDENLTDEGTGIEIRDSQNEEISEDEDMGGGEIGILKKQVENLENILKEKEEEILRRAADLDNYRKRITKETDDKVKFANQSLLKDFLPVLDNIEMTLAHTEEGSPLKEGIELTIKSFKDMLERYGMKEINAELNTAFDPAIHEAMMMDNNEEFKNNAITLCVQKGYILNDRVIRPAKVKVNKI